MCTHILTFSLPFLGPATLDVRTSVFSEFHRFYLTEIFILLVSEAYMIGDVQVSDLKSIMDVRRTN